MADDQSAWETHFALSRHIVIFRFSRRWPSAILDFFKIEILIALHFKGMLSITIPNFVEIGHAVSEILQFLSFLIVKCKNLLHDGA